MSMVPGMGPVWRHMRTDRSIVEQKLAPRHGAPGRSASPGRTAALIGLFLVAHGRRRRARGRHPAAGQAHRRRRHPQAGHAVWWSWLALAAAGVAVVDAGLGARAWAGSPPGSARG